MAAITEITDVKDDDETNRTEVIVYEVSGRRPHRVAAFSDVGRDGKLSSQMYFITRTEGCCALPTRYIVHNIDTGKMALQRLRRRRGWHGGLDGAAQSSPVG